MQNPVINSGTIISSNPGNRPSIAIPSGAYNNSMPVMGNMLGIQSPSMFMQPTFLSPGIPSMDLPQGIAQPFTQFVNGMPMQQSIPSVGASITDHPCQGKGGCGCGGSSSSAENNNSLPPVLTQDILNALPTQNPPFHFFQIYFLHRKVIYSSLRHHALGTYHLTTLVYLLRL